MDAFWEFVGIGSIPGTVTDLERVIAYERRRLPLLEAQHMRVLDAISRGLAGPEALEEAQRRLEESRFNLGDAERRLADRVRMVSRLAEEQAAGRARIRPARPVEARPLTPTTASPSPRSAGR